MSLLLLFRPFGAGGPPPTPPPVAVTVPGGVRRGKKRQVVIRLSDIENRADTAEFLKAQLRLRHPDSAFTEPAQEPAKPTRTRLSKADKAKQSALAAEALRAMQIESANEERRIIDAQNVEILKLILLASL